jgi:excisionase family DNA binding protein
VDKRTNAKVEVLLTTEQVAELLAVKVSTIRQWTHTGYIPHLKLGKLVRFREADISGWLEKRSVKGRVSRRIDVDTLLLPYAHGTRSKVKSSGKSSNI